MTRCPVCSNTDVVDTVKRDRLPAMQNYVYRTRQSALAAPEGELTVAVCRTCGFAWNRTFDPSRLVYDAGYDNAVPSTVVQAYYRAIAEHLADTYDLEDGLVVDIGCGNGAFLKVLCDTVPSCRGLGIDPALDRERHEHGGRVALVKDVFRSAAVEEPPSLVVCRHVLEHIPRPVEFLRTIGDALARFDSCPCFFEVPDLEWIVENEAFWDFCYEHCNYFTAGSLHRALGRAGFEPTTTTAAFGLQYRWMEAIAANEPVTTVDSEAPNDPAGRLLAYALTEVETIASLRRDLLRWKTHDSAIAVWGMATKGVLFSSLVDRDASLIDFCIDINPNKQGCFVPLTAHTISAPDVLQEVTTERLLVVIMNDNYLEEIKSTCLEMHLRATYASASSISLPASHTQPRGAAA